MSSQVSRHVFPVAAAVLILAGGMSRTAAAKECASDSDCSAADQCVFGATAAGSGGATGSQTPGAGATTGSICSGANCASEASPPPLLVPDAGAPLFLPSDAGTAPVVGADAGARIAAPLPIATGVCEPKPIVCTTVADCPSADFECQKLYLPTTQPACAADTKCEALPPQESSTGTCQAKPHACSTATDCPAPLICQAQGATCSGGGGVGPDGVVTTIPTTCTAGPSVCTWVPVDCLADSDCADPLYQCLKVSEYNMCSGATPACRSADGAATCSAPEPPTCTSVVKKNCLPKPLDCGTGQACPSGWSCFDFSGYNAGVRPTWSPNAPDKACLPNGIILAAQGHASDNGQFSSNSGSTRSSSGGSGAVDIGLVTPTDNKGGTAGTTGGAPSGQGSPEIPPTVAPVAAPGGSTSTATDTAGSAKVQGGGGCAFGGHGAGSMDLIWAMALLGLAVRLVRRHRASN
jgi:hypothetical protein